VIVFYHPVAVYEISYDVKYVVYPPAVVAVAVAVVAAACVYYVKYVGGARPDSAADSADSAADPVDSAVDPADSVADPAADLVIAYLPFSTKRV